MTSYRSAFLTFICIFACGIFTIGRGEAPNSDSSAQQDEIAKVREYFEKHSLKPKCDPSPINNYPRWEGFPVQNCFYTDLGVTTKAYMLNPSPDQLAQWVVTACHDAQAASINKCIDHMESVIKDASSGGIFPVAGYIVEPSGSTGGSGSAPLCLLFRDGVTIATDSWDTQAPINGKCGSEDENNKPARRAKKYARVASTMRQDYRNAGGTDEVGTDETRDVRWLDVVRKLYQEAWTSNRNQLISAKAKAEKAAGAFQ